MVKALAIQVPLDKGEKIRKKLLKEGFLRKDLKIRKKGEFLYLPVKEEIKGEYEYVEMDFENVGISVPSYKELVNIPSRFKPLLPSSFDVVGDIGIIKIPEELLEYKEEIGKGLLSFGKKLRVVCIDKGVREEYRIRDIEIIAGEKRTETVHQEYGMKIKVDVARVYYSPRLATERYRVARKVRKGDIVIDLFAGVAPFSILISLIAEPSKVYAIDINPLATKYARMNAQENGVDDIIQVINDDARNAIKMMKKKKIIADRLIMNLPHSAHEFFADAVPISKMIHYYEIIEIKKIGERLKWLKKSVKEMDHGMKIKDLRTIKSYSPEKIIIGVDMIIEEKV